VVNDPVLGFDFITEDISSDPKNTRWGIIECNAVPFINLHHDPLEGEPINVAGKLWDYIAKKHGVITHPSGK
jgi:D-alanine-D-alanine ligase-like ATP-grasp enzyme